MDEKLDEAFRLWLERIAIGKSTIEEVPQWLGEKEIANRHETYPDLKAALSKTPLALDSFATSARKAWGAGGQYDLTHFSDFIRRPDSAEVIAELISDFPNDDIGTQERIDRFVGKCLSLGYTHPNNRRRFVASAGLLASTILTAMFPQRFVDFRATRWEYLAKNLKYELFATPSPTYGEMIVLAGHFATAIVATGTFRRLWGDRQPLWTIAGICWYVNWLEKTGAKKEGGGLPATEEQFLQQLRDKRGEEEARIAERILERLKFHSARLSVSKAATRSVVANLDNQFGKQWLLIVMRADGVNSYIPFSWMSKRLPFEDEGKRRELARLLNEKVGTSFSDDVIDSFPTFALSILRDEARLNEFMKILDWTAEQIRNA
jgi:hypothetical protein